MSTDHGWGPRVDLYLREDVPDDLRGAIRAALDVAIPGHFRGWPTRFAYPDAQRGRAPTHAVTVSSPIAFLRLYLGIDATQPLEPADWLTLPTQKLRTIACDALFHDDVGFSALRTHLAWYPRDVWLYLLASVWTRIGQEEHLTGRAGSVDDEIGAALIAGRLVRDLMRLCFLMERQVAPYPKWFGSAFQQLQCDPVLSSHLGAVLCASTWVEREAHLVPAFETVAAMHNALDVTPPLATTVGRFFSRPFASIALNGFAEALAAEVLDPGVRRLLDRPLIGSVDLISDNTDILETTLFQASLRRLYD